MGRLADEMSAIFLTSKMSASFFFDVKNVSEFFFDASDFINLRFRVRKAPERRRPGAVAPPVRSKQVIRMSGGSVGGSAPRLGLETLFFKMRIPRVIRTEFSLTITRCHEIQYV